jgi:hemoglobin
MDTTDTRLLVYELVGGEDTFRRLVHAFYGRVYADPRLRPLFPDDRMGAEDRLTLFLMQYFGGPTTYSQQRGHPRLRMRHFPFAIGQAERDAWLGHMLAALDEVGVTEPALSAMRDYFEYAATFMINQSGVGSRESGVGPPY